MTEEEAYEAEQIAMRVERLRGKSLEDIARLLYRFECNYTDAIARELFGNKGNGKDASSG